MERGKYDGEETSREKDRLLAHPYLGRTGQQRTRTEYAEQSDGPGKKEQADECGDARSENDVPQKLRCQFQKCMAGIHFLYCGLCDAGFPLCLGTLSEAGSKGRPGTEALLEPDQQGE